MKNCDIPDYGDKFVINDREFTVQYTDYHKGHILLAFDPKQLVNDKQQNAIEELKND